MKVCAIEGCSRPHRARGMCTTHRYRSDQGLPLDVPVRQYEHDGVCKLEDCGRNRNISGELCDMHYSRQRRHGDVGSVERQRAPFGEAVWNEPNYSRRAKLLREYGLTEAEYDQMLAAQGGGCAVCKSRSPQSARAKTARSFCVDHDHETGHVRGLLCQACNRAIGMLQDDVTVVESAARYLRAHQQAPLFGPAKRSA